MNPKQRLELNWIGKDEELHLEPRILIEDPSKSYGEKGAENMLIHGDNLLALKALEQDFAGKIKCAYIDPPYNTGSAFEHYDDNIEHSMWLNLIQPRLEIIRKLLSADGSIWVSIDDTEHAYLKVLLDQVFGRKNFVANITVIVKTEGRRYGQLAKTHEYILCYAKDIDSCEINELQIENKQFRYRDDLGGFDLRELRNQNTRAFNSSNRPNLRYPFYVDQNRVNDDGFMQAVTEKSEGLTEVWPIETNGLLSVWRWGRETATKEAHQLVARKGSDGIIRIHQKIRSETTMAKTVWFDKEFITNKGTKESQTLFADDAFSFPKPEKLMNNIISLATKQDDWVLDSFVGSGTTAAVAHKMKRRYVAIEFGEHANTHCLPRLKKVIDGKDELPLSEDLAWEGGGGIKFFDLAPSLLKQDRYGNWVIDSAYNADMLAHAVAKHEGFKYNPHPELYWKQGISNERDFIFTTTSLLTVEQIDRIREEMADEESLLICAKSFQEECADKYDNVTVKKIPQAILGRCEFGKENYNLNILRALEEAATDNEA